MVCNKCSNPSADMKCAKCKVASYCNRECQAADWPTHKQRCKSFEMNPKKLELQFFIGREGAPITFREDIPKLLCKKECPREISSQWVSQIVDTREMEALRIWSERYNGQTHCLYCTKPPTRLYTTVLPNLDDASGPTIHAVGQPVCSLNRDNKCALQAEKNMAEGTKNANNGLPINPKDIFRV